MKKLSIILGSILGVIILAALIIPSFIDWKQYEAKARTALVEATGYDAEIGGGLGLSILPSPRVTAKNVKLFAPSSAEHPLVTLQEAQIVLSPFSLLVGKVKISSIVLEDGTVLLYKDANGHANWDTEKKKKEVTETSAADTQSEDNGSSSRVEIDQIYLSNITIRIEDLQKKSMQQLLVKNADVTMDSLSGPFKTDAEITYQGQTWEIEGNIGDIKKKGDMPIAIRLYSSEAAAKLSFNGVADIQNEIDAQGEFDLVLKDFSKFYTAVSGGKTMSTPVKDFAMKGMISASADRVLLDDGALVLNGAPADVTMLLSGLQADLTTLSSTVDFKEMVDLNFLKERVQQLKTKTSNKSASVAGGEAEQFILPADVSLPQNLKANLNIIVPGIKYNGSETGKVVLAGVFDDKNLKFDIDAFSLPEKTSFNASTLLSFASKENVSGTNMALYKAPTLNAEIIARTQNFRGVLVDWLGVVDIDQIPAQMPGNVNFTSNVKLNQKNARIDLKDVNIGQTAIKGFVNYALPNKKGSFPLITADINGGNLVLPDLLASTNADNNGGASKASSASNPEQMVPQSAKSLPYNLDIKLSMDKLTLGDKDFHNLLVDFEKTDRRLNITNIKVGDYINTSLGVAGVINNYETLSGLDLKVNVKSENIDPLLAQHKISLPASLPTPVGKISADVALKGEIQNASFNAQLNAYGFTGSVAGESINLMSAQLPQVMNVALTHPNSERAVQFLRPEYRAQSKLMDAPFSIKAQVKSASQVSDITNMTLKIGPSTLTGDVTIKQGAIPYVKASLNADTLPVDILAGGSEDISNSGSATASSQATRAPGQTPWSRDAINTSGLRAVNADMVIKAQKFSYGHSVLHNALLNASLNNGTLDISKLSGDLDEGQLSGNVVVKALQEGQPINVTGSFALSNATVASVSKVILGKPTRKLNGGMAMNVDLTASGLSSAALVSALNGQGRMQIINPVLQGIDIKSLYNTLKSLDSFQGALSGLLQTTTTTGSTQFNSVDKNFTIVNGVIPIEGWDAKTDHALLLSNGKIDFPNWIIDITNNIQIQGVDNLPSFGMRIYGPLDAPQTTITKQSLEDYLQGKVGTKVRDIITDKLISEDVQNKVKDKLGVGIGDLLPLGTRDPANNNTASEGTSPDTANDNEDPKAKLFRGLMKELTK